MNCRYSGRVFSAFAAGSTEVVGGDLTIMVIGNVAIVEQSKTTATGDLVIPDTYRGCPVTHIETSAFAGCSNLTSVTIPDSVTSIGEYAFWGCRSFTTIIFKGNAPKIGQSVFGGVSYDDSEIIIYSDATGFSQPFGGLFVSVGFRIASTIFDP